MPVGKHTEKKQTKRQKKVITNPTLLVYLAPKSSNQSVRQLLFSDLLLIFQPMTQLNYVILTAELPSPPPYFVDLLTLFKLGRADYPHL